MAKMISHHGAFATFSGGDERGFWGSTGRPGESGSSFRRRPYRNATTCGISEPGLGPSGCALHAPGEKAFCRAGSRAFSGGGTKWRHNTSRVYPAHRKISLGRLG